MFGLKTDPMHILEENFDHVFKAVKQEVVIPAISGGIIVRCNNIEYYIDEYCLIRLLKARDKLLWVRIIMEHTNLSVSVCQEIVSTLLE